MLPKPIYDEPEYVSVHPYINFLRYMKRIHPEYGYRRLMQKGLIAWEKLNMRERKLFERERLLRYLVRFHGKAACNRPPQFDAKLGFLPRKPRMSMARYRARNMARNYRLKSKWRKANRKYLRYLKKEMNRLVKKMKKYEKICKKNSSSTSSTEVQEGSD